MRRESGASRSGGANRSVALRNDETDTPTLSSSDPVSERGAVSGRTGAKVNRECMARCTSASIDCCHVT